MKKFLLTLVISMLITLPSMANDVDKIIGKSPISKNATVSVSVRNLKTGFVFYENDSQKLLNPASTLKAFTTPVIYNQLGDDFQFKTQLYKANNNTAYLKLSADPMLNSRTLRHLVRSMRTANLKQPDKFYIDDFVVDNQEYGIGWQWDDEVSKYIPKYSSYNLDGNVFSVFVAPSTDKKTINITAPKIYNVAIVNKLVVGKTNKINVQRNFWDGTEKVVLSGTVNTPTNVEISVYNQKRYFLNSLKDNLNSVNVRYYGFIESKKTPENATLVDEKISDIKPMYSAIMNDSNNMYSETLFKIAGGKFVKSQGTTNAGLKAFKSYYEKIGVDLSDIVVVDASGISRNDLLTTDWMSNALVKINKNDSKFVYKERFNKPNVGTMTNRLFDLRDYLWAKTGTLANTSGLTGYLTTKKGNEYAFAILIQNTNKPIEDAKKLEDEIVTTLYEKY